jgi:hypothetical protein
MIVRNRTGTEFLPRAIVEHDEPLLALPLGQQEQVGQQEKSQLLLRHASADNASSKG